MYIEKKIFGSIKEEIMCLFTHLISSLYYFSINLIFTGVISRYTEHAHITLRAQSFPLGQPHFQSGGAAHSTAEMVNSQDASVVKQLMECKKAKK
jgi:hypothetical protein